LSLYVGTSFTNDYISSTAQLYLGVACRGRKIVLEKFMTSRSQNAKLVADYDKVKAAFTEAAKAYKPAVDIATDLFNDMKEIL
jgi:hypothetical protein